ncbi:hypothetical protein Metfor_1936 [Methanoregula formicica SMSP]|uniref:Uncharacterized protein n=1 Tax=Methanoregula formicica (strain DSM 22288 / NBRC 105244 / SMSP) TaxID=593750 RepID=L0HIP3_METFS|nr:hypothetical protein Metfor_1936 [Methanoregula formicica SMSP]
MPVNICHKFSPEILGFHYTHLPSDPSREPINQTLLKIVSLRSAENNRVFSHMK